MVGMTYLVAICWLVGVCFCGEGNFVRSEDASYEVLVPRPKRAAEEIIRIAFGSCFKNYVERYRERYEIFSKIEEKKPDVWLWMGDAIYANYPIVMGYQGRFKLPQVDEFFTQMEQNPHYKNLKENSRVIGVWDDHDYGMHDGDTTFIDKNWFKDRYLEFIGDEESARNRQNDGIYTSYCVDSKCFVKIILLDIHYSRKGQEDLGALQVEWLKKEIADPLPQTFLLVTASPLIAHNRPAGDCIGDETRQLILTLIKNRKAQFLILSGEIHFAELVQLGFNTSRRGDPADLHEVVSSGLSHTTGFAPGVSGFIQNTFNDHGMRFLDRNFGILDINFKEQLLEASIYDSQGQRTNLTLTLPLGAPTLLTNEQVLSQLNVTQRLTQNLLYQFNKIIRLDIAHIYFFISMALWPKLKFIIIPLAASITILSIILLIRRKRRLANNTKEKNN